MESKIGLIIQFAGVFLIAVLSLFLRRSLKTAASSYWAAAWASLSVALFSLSFGFLYANLSKPLFAVYFLGEYIFGLLLVFGCRALVEDYEPPPRSRLIFAPFALLACVLPFAAADFNLAFNLHALLFGTFFGVAFAALGRVRPRSFGWRTMRVALALLMLDFYHYFALFALSGFDIKIPLPVDYPAFNPVIDLVLEVMLGFGMVIILLEQVLEKMKKVNEQLHEAHARLEQTAHVDPLTTALNRHAFYGFLNKRGNDPQEISGCVGFFDIDDLKPINDQLGHVVGDVAIRAVVSAIRELVRAEDLIYRWGGDEFFVLLVSMNRAQALERMSTLDRKLTDIRIEGAERPLTIRVSYGFNDFSGLHDLEAAIKAADEEMYRGKQARKLRRRLADASVFLSNDNIRISAER